MKAFRPLVLISFALGVFAASGVRAETETLNASYHISRELFVAVNAAFVWNYKAAGGGDVVIKQSHAGSSRRARSILEDSKPMSSRSNRSLMFTFSPTTSSSPRTGPRSFRTTVNPITASTRSSSGRATRRGLGTGPTSPGPTCRCPVTFRREDQLGNLANPDHHAPALEVWRESALRPVVLEPLVWGGPDGAWVRSEITLREPGDYRLVAGEAEALVTIDPAAPVPRALFADLHVHSEDTVGVKTTRAVLAFARDAAGLEVAGHAANDFNVRADRWDAAVAVCRELDEERRFLCFPGTEWCGASAVGGDRHVIFLGEEVRFPLDRDGRSLRVFD